MGRPASCGCCCPETFNVDCDDSGLPGLAHESVGSYRFISNTGAVETYTEELISIGCSHDLEWLAFGYNGPDGGPTQRLKGTIQPAGDDWIAGIVLWSDTWDVYDPFLQGSVNQIVTSAVARTFSARTDLPSPATGDPELLFVPVIEQDRKTYIDNGTNTMPVSRCWKNIGSSSTDGADVDPVGSRNAHFSRKPYTFEDWTKCQYANANAGRCEDNFYELGTGSTLPDSRPDLSYGIESHEVTRAGVFVGVKSADAWQDDVTVDLLFDELCGTMKTWGIYRIGSNPVPDSENYPVTDNVETLYSNRGCPLDLGTLIIDEPLDTLPGGWQRADVYDSTGPGAAAGVGIGGQFAIVDGLLTSDTVSNGEYLNGAYFATLTGMPTPPFSDDFQLLIEFTWHNVRDADRCNPLFGISAPDPEEYRNAAHGVFLGDAFRFTANCMAADDYDSQQGGPAKYHDAWHYGYTVHTIPDTVGGLQQTYSQVDENMPFGWDDLNSIARNTSIHPARYGYDANLGNAFTPPMSGDRYSILINRAVNDAGVGARTPWDNETYRFRIYSNGRDVTPMGGGITLFPKSGVWNIGVIGLFGGRWSDFKVWLRE